MRVRCHAWLVLTVAAALAIRLVVAWLVFHRLTDPANGHDEFGWEMGWTARSLATGHGFSSPFPPMTGPTALVPPLYPFLLALIFRVFGLYTAHAAFVALALNSVLSAATCIPVYGAARDALGSRIGRWAAIGWAVYPFGVYFSAVRPWDYALTGLLFSWSFWKTQRLTEATGYRPWVVLGLLYGLTALSNPSVLPALAVLLCIALWRRFRTGRALIRQVFSMTIVLVTMLLPWGIRNYRVMHAVFPVRDGFWLEFYVGNTTDTFESNVAWAHPPNNPVEMQAYQSLGEVAYLAQCRDSALRSVASHKLLFLESTARRVVRFWTGYWSFSPAYRAKEPMDIPNVPFCLALTALQAMGLVWWWRSRDRGSILPYAVLVLVFPLPYYVTHASTDYRMPIEPQLVVLTAAGVAALQERRMRRADTARDSTAPGIGVVNAVAAPSYARETAEAEYVPTRLLT